MEELEELLDELPVDVLLLDESVEVDDDEEELDSVLLVLTECELLDSVDSLEPLLLERLLRLDVDDVAEDVLLLDTLDVLELDSVLLLSVEADDPLELLRECDELLVLIECVEDEDDELLVWVELLADDVLDEVVIDWLDELLLGVDWVDKLDGLLLDSVLWLVMLVSLELELLDDDELDSDEVDSVLDDRLEALDVLVLDELADEVLELLAELVLDVLALDVLLDDTLEVELLESVLLESVDVELLDSLDALDSLSSSAAMIRSSFAMSAPCGWPLWTTSRRSSVVLKSRMAGAFTTPPIVSRKMARNCSLSSSVWLLVSTVFASAAVVMWSL